MRTHHRYLIVFTALLLLLAVWWLAPAKHPRGMSHSNGSALYVTKSGEIVPVFYAQRDGNIRYLLWLGGVSESTARELRVVDSDTTVTVVDRTGDAFVGPLPADGGVYEFADRSLVGKSIARISHHELNQRQKRAHFERLADLSQLVEPTLANR
ncbi:MAG: hypothetical protein U1F81_21055 [Verrucomicrobiaceae bacterium]